MVERRKKASEIFNENNLVFARKVAFDEAFPEIDTINVTVVESGSGIYDQTSTRSYDKHSLGEYIDCSNPACYRGGFSVGSMIQGMVSHKETHTEESTICQGNEGSPKGRRIYRKCINFFKVVIDIQYKAD